jgi:D-glycero-D-manno-heptose 1,7-bisphosphate phosphatase
MVKNLPTERFRVASRKRAVFLDKDGLLIENVPAPGDRGGIRLGASAVDGLLLLAGLEYEIIVASNQPGVAHGRFPPGALKAVEEHLADLFMACGLRLADCYWCPHDAAGAIGEYALQCACRKPQPGLLRAAALEHDLDLASSWAIGGEDDVEAGRRAGCRTLLTGNLLEAAAVIASHP